MGDVGAVVMPFAGDAETTHRHVLDKPWSKAENHKIRQTPAILIIDRGFDDFDPRHHSWVLFHFDRGADGTYAAKLRSFLQKLSDAVASTDTDAFELVRRAMRLEAIGKASTSFKLEPGAFGVSIDLRVVWEAFKEYLRGTKAHGA